MSQPTAYSLVPTDALTDHAADLRRCANRLDVRARQPAAAELALHLLADRIRAAATRIDALIAADKTNSPL